MCARTSVVAEPVCLTGTPTTAPMQDQSKTKTPNSQVEAEFKMASICPLAAFKFPPFPFHTVKFKGYVSDLSNGYDSSCLVFVDIFIRHRMVHQFTMKTPRWTEINITMYYHPATGLYLVYSCYSFPIFPFFQRISFWRTIMASRSESRSSWFASEDSPRSCKNREGGKLECALTCKDAPRWMYLPFSHGMALSQKEGADFECVLPVLITTPFAFGLHHGLKVAGILTVRGGTGAVVEYCRIALVHG